MKQGKQQSTRELEQQAQKTETFNPLWHKGEFQGPNTERCRAEEEEKEKE